jgi:beta-glucuronidase
MADGAQSTPPDDPFAHLHEENYAADFEAPLIGAAPMPFRPGRAAHSLAGDWGFVLDPFREGLRQRWFAHDATPIDAWQTPRDCDDGAWQTMAVPGCWTTARDEWRHYEGAAWYQRGLDAAPPAPGERVFLRIGAASGRCRVFLNGAFLGLHRGGWTAFAVEIGPHLRARDNHLMIEVDTTRRDDSLPMSHFDWFNHGGLFRAVEVLRVPETFIADTRLHLDADGRVEASVTLSGPAEGTARLEIAGLGSADIPVAGGRGRVSLDLDPRLWSPEGPHLYDVTLRFGADQVADRIGFRRIERRGTGLWLNGKPLQLRGLCVHEDDRETGFVATEADLRRRFADLRALGGNALRLAHYPHCEEAAQIADEVGVLLWEEIPVYWAIAFEDLGTQAEAQHQLTSLIRRDANRASVILWGIGNENADSDARLAFMAGLAQAARVEDPTRLIAAACLINRSRFRIEDRLTEHLDVIGLNEYFGWYEPGFEGLARLLANSTPDRPVVISETGADALAGHHGPEDQLFTEEHQARVLSTQVAMADDCPYIAGIFPWLLYDFRSARRQTRYHRGWNRKGLIAEDKTTRKLGFAALQAAYSRHFRKGES